MKGLAFIVFIKNFQLGRVKTRIAASLGQQKALEIYYTLAKFTVEELKKTGLPVYFYFSEYTDEDFLEGQGIKLDSDLYHAKVQTPDDLGTRMADAFAEVLLQHSGALLLGTDCPYFTASQMIRAMKKLEHPEADIVLGPAKDGGYYGLGMKTSHDVFSEVSWSTEFVFSQTMQKIRNANLRHMLLPMLNDLDHAEDWAEFTMSPMADYFWEVIRSSSSANDSIAGV